MSSEITVLGAGSVGISTAIHLQQRGWHVTLVDAAEPATKTSFGNAGVINSSSFIPLNNHELWKSLPKYLLNNKPQIRYTLARVLLEFPWLAHFLKHANQKDTANTATALYQLCKPALDEHKAFMQRVGNMHRLTERGWLKVYRHTQGYKLNNLNGSLYHQHNINTQVLSADDIYDLEPSLKRIFCGGYLLTDSAQIDNPNALLTEYVQQFSNDGGTVLQQKINSLSYDGSIFTLHSSSNLTAQNLVIAAGAWSAEVIKPLGYRTNLGIERGYHQHFHPADNASLSRTLYDVDAGYIMAPMQAGIRLTTGVELAQQDAPPNYAQLNQVIPRAFEAFPLSEPTDDPIWCGNRPTLPDSKPIIDQAPAHKNLWLAFGHQHIGLMSGPITGKLLAQRIDNESTDIDLHPFNAKRWIKC